MYTYEFKHVTFPCNIPLGITFPAKSGFVLFYFNFILFNFILFFVGEN